MAGARAYATPPTGAPRALRRLLVRYSAALTGAEMRELGEWDWWYAHPYNVLHAADVEYDPLEEVAGDGVTACGWKAHLAIPGIFSRMGLRRCARCCRKLGYPQGIGSPKNDAACRPLIKQRLAIRRPSPPP